LVHFHAVVGSVRRRNGFTLIGHTGSGLRREYYTNRWDFQCPSDRQIVLFFDRNKYWFSYIMQRVRTRRILLHIVPFGPNNVSTITESIRLLFSWLALITPQRAEFNTGLRWKATSGRHVVTRGECTNGMFNRTERRFGDDFQRVKYDIFIDRSPEHAFIGLIMLLWRENGNGNGFRSSH